jgi:hypothetical protein
LKKCKEDEKSNLCNLVQHWIPGLNPRIKDLLFDIGMKCPSNSSIYDVVRHWHEHCGCVAFVVQMDKILPNKIIHQIWMDSGTEEGLRN